MKLVPAKCPNCGANINVDEEQETTKCEYCGDAILIDKAIQKYKVEITVSNMPDLDNYLILGERTYNDNEYNKSYEYYNKAIELDPNNFLVVLRLGILKELLSDFNQLEISRLNNSVTNAIKLSNLDEGKYKIIVNETFECIKKIEFKCKHFYDNNELYIDETIKLNNICSDILDVLEKILSIIEKNEGNNDINKNVLLNIIDFTDFAVMPKHYILENGEKSSSSYKIGKIKMKEMYNFCNSCIIKYNAISDEKIEQKKIPILQLDNQLIKRIMIIFGIIILFLILLISYL